MRYIFILFILISSGCQTSKDEFNQNLKNGSKKSQARPAFEFIKETPTEEIQRQEEPDDEKSDFNVGGWQINYDKSYVTVRDISYKSQDLAFMIGNAFGDYLYFDRGEDIAYYALRLEEVAVVSSKLGDRPEKNDSKIKWDRIALPIGSVLKEFFAPRVEILMTNLTGEKELRIPVVLENVKIENMEMLPATIDTNLYGRVSASGKIFDGSIDLKGRVNPFYEPKILDLNLKVENVSLTELNPFLREFAKVDAIKGKISVFIESAVKGDRVVGYVRFETADAEMTKGWKQEKSFWRNIKENLADLAFRLFSRGKKSEVVGKVSFEGKVANIEWDFWKLFRTVLRHAVVAPMDGKLENSINLETLEESSEGKLAE